MNPRPRIHTSVHGRFTILNISLIALCAGLLFYYLMLANGFTAAQFKLSSLHNELVYYGDLNSSLVSEKNTMENPDAALGFIGRQHMVEAKNISYVFENGNVALGR